MDEVHFRPTGCAARCGRRRSCTCPKRCGWSASATVSNAEEFGGWIQTVRGDTTVVVDEHRPVPLSQHMMVGKRLFDLFEGAGRGSLVDPNLLRHHRSPPRGGPAGGLAAAWPQPGPAGPPEP